MLLGPVFHAELLTTARRPRYYFIRVLYGLIILAQIYLSYQANRLRVGNGSGELRIHDMAEFGENIFLTFAVVQAVVVVLLTPALVGGSIAEEKQRKTLHYLLTSHLTGFEIVVGKLASRLLHVGVLVALGLPVVSLIGLFGGIDFKLLLLSYAATLTSIYFLASASILVSTLSRRPREAIALLYVLELIWLVVPSLLITALPQSVEPWPTIARWVNPVLEYLALTSPIYFLPRAFVTNFSSLIVEIAWGMGLQIAYGTAFVILAAVRLRPAYRNDGGTAGWVHGLAKLTGKRRWFPRPECGDDAMLWKEMYVARTGGLTKAGLVVIGVALVGIMGYAAYGFLEAAIHEIHRDGYFSYGSARRDFNYFLRGVSTAIYLLWMLGVATSAAGGLSSEREEDQWISLVSTPLDGFDILRAKMIGPAWGLRLVAYLMFLLWGVGLLVGSIHPFGLLVTLVEFAVFTWFLTALGTTFSLWSKNSTRALATTMLVLIFINGGYLFCCIPLQPDSPVVTAGSTPFLFLISLLSIQDFGELSTGYKTADLIGACVIGVLGYALAALGLTVSLFSSFDQVVDRPDRSRQPQRIEREEKRRKADIGNAIVFPDEFA